MGKFYLVVAAGAGLLFALAASAQAGGGHGRTPGQAFNPPGLTRLPDAATTNGHFTNNYSTPAGGTISAPTAWTTKQTNNPGWNSSLVPPGLGSVPPSH